MGSVWLQAEQCDLQLDFQNMDHVSIELIGLKIWLVNVFMGELASPSVPSN
jgi:hypothetical protein